MRTVSCIVPVYNLENEVSKCIDSLLSQTLKNIEIILVNDCSTDNSLMVLQEYEEKYSNIIVLDLHNNFKQGGARNRGLEVATGKYVAFIDGDDWVEPDMFEQLYFYAEKNSFDIVDSDYYQDEANGESKVKQSINARLFPIKSTRMLICNGGRIWTKIFRREFLVENNIRFIEHKKFEDNPYLPILYAYTFNVGKINKPFYHYVYNENSTSRKKNDYTVFERLDTAKFLLEETRRREIYDKYTEEYNYVFIKLFYTNTLVTCITKFDVLPVKYINQIYNEVNRILPDYKMNKYLTTAPRYIRVFTKLNKVGVILCCILLSVANKIGFHKYLIQKGNN